MPAGATTKSIETINISSTGSVGAAAGSAAVKQVNTYTMPTTQVVSNVAQVNQYAFPTPNASGDSVQFTYGGAAGSFVIGGTAATDSASAFVSALNTVAGRTVAYAGGTVSATAASAGATTITTTTTNLVVGMTVSGTNIPSGTTITGKTATTITISQAVSGGSSGTTLTYAGGAGKVQVIAPTAGTALPSIAFTGATTSADLPTQSLITANSSTVTTAGAVAGDTVTFTYNGIQGTYTIGSSATATGDNFVAAINAVAGYTAAVNTSGSVAVTAQAAGTALPTISFSGTASNLPSGTVTTANAASGGTAAVFDVSSATNFAGLTALNVTASQGASNLKVAATTDANITNTTAGVTLAGGKSQTVAASGDTALTASTGAVSVTNNATGAGTTSVKGGTSVTVTQKGTGAVTVGESAVAPSNPTGAVTITASKNAAVTTYGGTNVTATVKGGVVQVGGAGGANDVAPTGAVSVTSTSYNGAYVGAITTNGGSGVTVASGGGGNITVGNYATGANRVAAGAVSVTDTNSNATGNTAAISVKGGTTVNVTTTATSGNISVGTSAGLATSGTALDAQTLATNPTGNVTIVNGNAAKYGTSTVAAYTNGATAVSVTGAAGVTIADAQATLATAGTGVGKAIGTSTLGTVSLERVTGDVGITSDALTTLNLKNNLTSSSDKQITITNKTTGHALALTVENVKPATGSTAATIVSDDVAGSLTLATTGTATNSLKLSGAKLTSVTFNNAADVTVSSLKMTTPVAATSTAAAIVDTIVANNTGKLALGDLSSYIDAGNSGYLSAINGASSTGAISVKIDPTKTSFTGGAGNDTVTLTTAAATKAIAGGTGTNTLIIDAASAAATNASTYISGFTVLGMGASANSDTSSAAFDATGYANLLVGQAITGDSTFSNVAANATLSLTANTFAIASTQKRITATLATDTTNDTINVNLGVNGPATGATAGVNLGSSSNNTLLTLSNYENLNITSNGVTTGRNFVTVTDTSAKSITLTGTSGITLTLGSAPVATIDASAMTSGAVDVTGVALKTTGATLTGGAGALTAKAGVTTTATDVITVGTGGGTLTAGLAGSTASSSGFTTTWTAGSTTFNLANSAVSDTVVIANAVSGSNEVASYYLKVNGFNVANSGTRSDKIDFKAVTTSTAKKVLATSATPATAASGVQSYTVSNGIINFAPIGANTPTLSQKLEDARAIVGNASVATSGTASAAAKNNIAAFVDGGNTYVVSSGNTTTAESGSGPYTAKADAVNVVVLNGVSLSTLGNFAASGAAVISSGVTYTADARGASTAISTSNTFTETGYNAVSLAITGASGAAPTSGGATIVQTINGLASAGEVVIVPGTSGYHVGEVVVNQAGAEGANNLTTTFSTSGVLNKLTTNGAWAIRVQNADSVSGTGEIRSIVDGSVGQTLTTVQLAGSYPVKINTVTGTGFTTIDASAAAAATVGNAVGTLTGPLGNNGITFLAPNAASGGTAGFATAYLSGAGDTLTLNSATRPVTGGGSTSSYYLSGANDVVNAPGVGTLGGNINLYVTGTGANIDVSKLTAASSKVINIYGADSSSAIAANAVVKLGTGYDASNPMTLNAGTNTTVSVAPYNTINVSKATYGTTGAMTTIQLGTNPDGTAVTSFSNDKIVFNTVSSSTAVNVSSATSLGDALVIADAVAEGTGTTATQYALVWFQYGGDTYMLQSGNNAALTAAVDSTDVVVKITGIVDVSGSISSNAVTIA